MKDSIYVKNQGNRLRENALLRILQFDWLSGHASPKPPKTVVLTFRKLRCLFARKNQLHSTLGS